MTSEHGMMQRRQDSDFRIDDEYDEDTHWPQQRNAANARERARMRVLSKAFCRLKTTLPWVPPDTKLSKLDTLRLATGYIAHLRAILKLSENETPDPTTQPLNMSWPFNFQMNWDKQASSKSAIIDATSPKNEWSNHTQYPIVEEACKSKTYYDFNSERILSPNRNTRHRRRNDFQHCQSTKSTVYNFDNDAASGYYRSYKSCAYYNHQ